MHASITRRLILSVLLLETLAGVALVGAVAVNERRVQYKAFDANLRATSNALLGAIQEDVDSGVRLDRNGISLPGESVLRVTDERGRVLGSEGDVPRLSFQSDSFQHAEINGHSYRFFMLKGEKTIDPGIGGGIRHDVEIVYGLPDQRVGSEVMEAIRFFALATAVLLGITTLLLVWLVRKLLSPIHALADAASQVTPDRWHFDPPASASRYAELHPLTAAIESTIARLQRSFEQQRRFTSDAAHELKTDLAIVKSSLQLLAMLPRSAEEYERGLAVGLEDLLRLERTIQKMLTLARLEQPEARGSQVCRIDEALRAAVQQSVPLADLHAKHVMVGQVPPATVPLDSEDAALLCCNILSNALQHTQPGGTVEITCGFEADHFEFAVRDHGPGINDEEVALLFEPFYRGDPSRSRTSGGTGLGLSICKALCDRVGGSIAIANHAEGGAIVTVVLPAMQPAELAALCSEGGQGE